MNFFILPSAVGIFFMLGGVVYGEYLLVELEAANGQDSARALDETPNLHSSVNPSHPTKERSGGVSATHSNQCKKYTKCTPEGNECSKEYVCRFNAFCKGHRCELPLPSIRCDNDRDCKPANMMKCSEGICKLYKCKTCEACHGDCGRNNSPQCIACATGVPVRKVCRERPALPGCPPQSSSGRSMASSSKVPPQPEKCQSCEACNGECTIDSTVQCRACVTELSVDQLCKKIDKLQGCPSA